jgi:nitrate reductase delta subunit
MSEKSLYEKFAILLSYPGADYHQCCDQCRELLPTTLRKVQEEFGEFRDRMAGLSMEEMQELFTRTFDLNPMCTLEIGWQLYGEDYGRGEFLVKMREHLRAYEIKESGELPDHLSHALALLPKLEGVEAEEFARIYLLPAIDKMRSTWKENRNAYARLLDAIFELLKSDYPYDPARTPAQIPELRVLQ